MISSEIDDHVHAKRATKRLLHDLEISRVDGDLLCLLTQITALLAPPSTAIVTNRLGPWWNVGRSYLFCNMTAANHPPRLARRKLNPGIDTPEPTDEAVPWFLESGNPALTVPVDRVTCAHSRELQEASRHSDTTVLEETARWVGPSVRIWYSERATTALDNGLIERP